MLERLTQLSKWEQLGIPVAFAMLLLFVADRWVIKPISLEIKKLDAELVAARQEVIDNNKALRYKESVEEQYAQVKDLIGVSKDSQEGLNFKGDIDDMAPRNGIKVKSRKLLKPDVSDFLETYFVNIGGFEADIGALIHFLYEAHNAPGLLRVQRLVVGSQAPNSVVSGSMIIAKAMTRAENQE